MGSGSAVQAHSSEYYTDTPIDLCSGVSPSNRHTALASSQAAPLGQPYDEDHDPAIETAQTEAHIPLHSENAHSPPGNSPVRGLTSEASDEDWLQSGDLSTVQISPCPTAELEQYLMRHYMNRVCHLFCALDTAKSPWKTIHLPRALQGMSELSVTGKTSRIRNALQKALFSVSAWYLSNDHGRHDASDAADSWARVAAMYGFDAIALLKQAVEFDLYRAPRPKYKEFLATMLSMITVNVRGSYVLLHYAFQ